MNRLTTCVLVLVTGLAACSSTKHFPEEYDRAEEAIGHAEDAGAKDSSSADLTAARRSLKDARDAEKGATRDRDEAKDELEKARKRAEEATALLSAQNEDLTAALSRQEAQQQALASLDTRERELRAKGLTEEEIHRAIDSRRAVGQARLEFLDATVDTLREQVRLRELERKAAALAIDAAQARETTAEQRLEVARTLMEKAERQAKLAEAESVDERRSVPLETM